MADKAKQGRSVFIAKQGNKNKAKNAKFQKVFFIVIASVAKQSIKLRAKELIQARKQTKPYKNGLPRLAKQGSQ